MERVFLSPPNWFGFEAADPYLLLLSLLLLFLRVHVGAPRWYRYLAEHPALSAAALFLVGLTSRLLLLPRYPEPVPSGADDFGYLLLADTLRHGRLANPSHSFPEFFAQIFVLQTPSYSSMFNLGQGLLLAAGSVIAGHPWAAVLIAGALLPPLVYWMLRGWTTSPWALAGGALSIMLFGPLCYWTNCYWGGTLAACAGAILFGSIARLNRHPHWRYSLLAGVAIAVHLLTRPFESLPLFAGAAMLLPWRRRALRWMVLPIAAALGLIAFQNAQVTGKWTTLPYQLYRYQYGVPATFTFQRNPVPHAASNDEQEADYRVETAVHGYSPETLGTYCKRLFTRIRFLRFFLFTPLYLAALAGLRRTPRIGLTLLLFALASNFYPYFFPHYVAACCSLLILLAIYGLQQFRRAAPFWLSLCAAQFLGWYLAFAFGHPNTPTWNFLNGPDPQGRATIAARLTHLPGQHVVFVHYSPDHHSGEWIHNSADIDRSQTIFVHDIGPLENQQFLAAYPGRDVWLLKPDEEPPALVPYKISTSPFQDVQ